MNLPTPTTAAQPPAIPSRHYPQRATALPPSVCTGVFCLALTFPFMESQDVLFCIWILPLYVMFVSFIDMLAHHWSLFPLLEKIP